MKHGGIAVMGIFNNSDVAGLLIKVSAYIYIYAHAQHGCYHIQA